MPSTSHPPERNKKYYQWPADKITAELMTLLYHLRSKTGIPINQLIRKAILRFIKEESPEWQNDTIVKNKNQDKRVADESQESNYKLPYWEP